jgi:thymidylate synthase
MNNLDKQYQSLLRDILINGIEKEDRTGTGALSVFGRQIRHNMKEGFPLLTTKRMAWKSIVVELLWFLKGETNIKYLLENDCHIWNGDAIKNYEKHNGEIDWGNFITKEEAFSEAMKDENFAKKWGDLGPIYGKQWRDWNYQNKKNHYVTAGQPTHHDKHIDQIQNIITELKENPDSRRLMVNSWNVGELDQMVLPPCHYGFQIYTRELTIAERIKWVIKNRDLELENIAITEEAFAESTPKRAISLMWNQRSVDTFLGLPFNIASYGLLLTILAEIVNMVPDELIGNLGDTHLYLNHIKQAKEQREREPFNLPTLQIDKEPFLVYDFANYEIPVNIGNLFSDLSHKGFTLTGYTSHPAIKAPLSN